MDLTLGQLISVRQTYEKTLEQKLLEMDVWFQNHMWDGSGDENDPDFLSKEDFDGIQALTSKIQHMCIQIGCPNSVNPMIESIINRKLKRWLGNDPLMGSTEDKHKSVRVEGKLFPKLKKSFVGYHKGKQLRTNNDLARVRKSQTYYNDPSEVLVGHFRWNNRGYILSRQCTELLSHYYYSEFFTE